MKILHIAYSLGESSAATRLAQSQIFSHEIYFLLGRSSKLAFVQNRQVYATTLRIASLIFRVLEKILCYCAKLNKGEVFSFGISSALQAYILRQAIRRYKIDIVHLHWGGVGFMPLGAVRGLPVPVVITAHDYHFFTGGCHVPMGCAQFNIGCNNCPLTESRLAKRYIVNNMLRNSETLRSLELVVVAPSYYTEKRITNAHPSIKVEVIPNTLGSFSDLDGNTIDDLLKKYEIRRAANSNIITFIVVGVSDTFRQNKGKDILIRVLKDLHMRGYQTKLISIGEYYEIEGVYERKHIHAASSQELVQLYAEADLCLVPSRYETFSQVTLESIVCGTPVVAFDITGPRDIIKNEGSGFLVHSFDANAYSSAVEKALYYKQKNSASLKRFSSDALIKYSPEKICAKHDIIYANILNCSEIKQK